MSKQEQVLIVEPPTELRFRGPFTAQVTSYMKLKNPIDQKICFKIKTTAPKKYCVRPNCGFISPNNEVEVAVSLQPFEYDPSEKNKHKFMVLSTICPEGESTLDNIWANVKPEDTMDSKLKCVFEMPVENETAATEETAVAEDSRKRLVEQKTAPKGQTLEPSADLVKDYQSLRVEESHLRQENMELKEEILRLTRANAAQATAANNQPGYRYAMQEPQGRNIKDIAIVLVIALMSFLFGKFFL